MDEVPVGGSDVSRLPLVVSYVLTESVETSDDIVTSVGLIKVPVSVLTDGVNVVGLDGVVELLVVSVGLVGPEEVALVYSVVVSDDDVDRSEVAVLSNDVVASVVTELLV